MKRTIIDINILCKTLQYMSREPGLFKNGYIEYFIIGKYAKYVDLHFINGSVYNFDSYTKYFLYDQLLKYAKKHLEKWNQKEKNKQENKRFNHTKRQIEQIEKDL